MKFPLSEHVTTESSSFSWLYKRNWLENVRLLAERLDVTFPGENVLEVGAGVHNPYGCAVLSLMLGAHSAYSIDPGVPLDGYEELAREIAALALAESYGAENPARQALRAIVTDGVVSAVESGKLNHMNGSVEFLEFDRQYGIIHSNAVIEHVRNVPAFAAKLAKSTRSGGIHVHKIDFIDHTYYDSATPQDGDAFRFLTIDEDEGACNRMRYSEVLNIFGAAGLTHVATPQIWQRPVPDTIRETLAPRFREMDDTDLGTTCAVIVLAKH